MMCSTVNSCRALVNQRWRSASFGAGPDEHFNQKRCNAQQGLIYHQLMGRSGKSTYLITGLFCLVTRHSHHALIYRHVIYEVCRYEVILEWGLISLNRCSCPVLTSFVFLIMHSSYLWTKFEICVPDKSASHCEHHPGSLCNPAALKRTYLGPLRQWTIQATIWPC